MKLVRLLHASPDEVCGVGRQSGGNALHARAGPSAFRIDKRFLRGYSPDNAGPWQGRLLPTMVSVDPPPPMWKTSNSRAVAG